MKLRKFNSKKAQRHNLAEIIVGVVVLLLIVSIAPDLLAATKNSADFNKCKLTVSIKTWTQFMGKSAMEIDCPRSKLEFFTDHIESEYRDGEQVKRRDVSVIDATGPTKKFKELHSDIVLQVLAKETKKCWDKFSQGKVNPIDKNFLSSQRDNCMVCAEVSFNDEVSRSIQFGNLYQYFSQYKVPNHPDQKTYLEYFGQSTIESGIIDKEELQFDNLYLKTSRISPENYIIVYKQHNPATITNIAVSGDMNQVIFAKPDQLNCRFYN